MIEVSDLKKTFKQNTANVSLLRSLFGRTPSIQVTALEDITFSVDEGQFYSLLGRNGAGKTTAIKILCMLLLPDSGSATIAGFDVDGDSEKVRESIGVSIRGERSVYWRLSGRQNLEYFGQLYGLRGSVLKTRVDEIGDIIDLSDRLDDFVERYSMGMKQRLAIGCALIHRPRVLLLDEPTIGLDAASARQFRDFIAQDLRDREKVTIVYTTHYMHEAEEMSDRIGIINHGRIVAEGTPSQIIGMVPGNSIVTIEGTGTDTLDLGPLDALTGVEATTTETSSEGSSTIRIAASTGSDVPVAEVVQNLSSQGVEISNLEVTRSTLESAFLQLTSD